LTGAEFGERAALTGHSLGVMAVAVGVSPGRLLAVSGAIDSSERPGVWDVDSGRQASVAEWDAGMLPLSPPHARTATGTERSG
jgi:hypothetical protein